MNSNAPQRRLCTKSDEVRLAEEASKKYGSPAPTIFSKIIDKSIPANIIYEDDKVRREMTELLCNNLEVDKETKKTESVDLFNKLVTVYRDRVD